MLAEIGKRAAGYTAALLLFVCISTAESAVLTVTPTNTPAPLPARLLREDGAPAERTWGVPTPILQIGPECVGYALETWERSEPSPSMFPLDGDFIYRRAQLIDGHPDEQEGTTLEAGVEILHQYGLIHSAAYTVNVAEIKAFLLERGPVVFASPWHEGMRYPAPDGYAIPVGEAKDWHAYECNEWTEWGVDGQSFGCINSWGPYWNGDGHFRLHLTDVNKLVEEGAYAGLFEKPGLADMLFGSSSLFRNLMESKR